jgi:Derlin-2/3
MVYVWGRAPENVNIRMALFGVFQFNAPYLPWSLLLFSLFIGNPIETDMLGIIAGHIYYFLEYVYPHVADIRGWTQRRILITPAILHHLCGTDRLNVRVRTMYYFTAEFNYW